MIRARPRVLGYDGFVLDDEINKQRAQQAALRAWSECPVGKRDPEVRPATPETIEAAERLPRKLWNKRPGPMEGWFRRKDHLWPRHFGVAVDPDGILRISEMNTRPNRGLRKVDSFCFYNESYDDDSRHVAILLKDGRYAGSPSEIVECVARAIVAGR